MVTSLDVPGNESRYSNQVSGLPRLAIGWANLQWPPTINHTISAVDRTDTAYGQVWIDGYTNKPAPASDLRAQHGFGPANSDPNGNPAWTWTDASFNMDAGNNDEFKASMQPEAVGRYDYAFRYSTSGGYAWVYADLDGIGNGYSSAQAGKMTVLSSGDITPPAVPTGLTVVSASPDGVNLKWDPNACDPSLYGYEVLRSSTSGGPYTQIARVTGASYIDTDSGRIRDLLLRDPCARPGGPTAGGRPGRRRGWTSMTRRRPGPMPPTGRTSSPATTT